MMNIDDVPDPNKRYVVIDQGKVAWSGNKTETELGVYQFALHLRDEMRRLHPDSKNIVVMAGGSYNGMPTIVGFMVKGEVVGNLDVELVAIGLGFTIEEWDSTGPESVRLEPRSETLQ